MNRRSLLLGALGLLTVLPHAVLAQSRGPQSGPTTGLPTRGTELDGKVTFGGQADSGAKVYLVDPSGEATNDGNLADITAKAFREATADDNGHYVMLNVYAAEYRLLFVSAHVQGSARIAEETVRFDVSDDYKTVSHAF